AGQVFIADRDVTHATGAELRRLRAGIGMIFQHFNLLSSRTVADNVAFPLRLHGEHDEQQIQARVDELLALVGLTAHARKYHAQHPTTRRFVAEADHREGRGPEFPGIDGRLFRLSFRGAATYSPLLSRVVRDTGIEYNLLSGRVDRIKDTPYGQLTLAMHGQR